MLSPMTVALRRCERPVAAGGREVEGEQRGQKCKRRRWKEARVSVFSASNQPCLSPTIFTLGQICIHHLARSQLHPHARGRARADDAHTLKWNNKNFRVHSSGDFSEGGWTRMIKCKRTWRADGGGSRAPSAKQKKSQAELGWCAENLGAKLTSSVASAFQLQPRFTGSPHTRSCPLSERRDWSAAL